MENVAKWVVFSFGAVLLILQVVFILQLYRKPKKDDKAEG